MNFKQLCTDLSKEINEDVGKEMGKVFDYRFIFKGLDASARSRVIADQIATAQAEDEAIDWEFVETCWEQNIREFQYFALSYLTAMRQRMEKDDLDRLKALIIDKAEWDTNNILHKLVNIHTAYYPDLEDRVIAWSKEDNIWLKRVALLHQLGRAQYTRLDVLAEILDANLKNSDEIVQKAVLAALEDAYPDNQEFVKDYITKHKGDFAPALAKDLEKLIS